MNKERIYNFKKSLISKSKLFFKRLFLDGDFFQNEIVIWLLIFNFLANAADWTTLAFFINRLDGGIILHYNVYFGVDEIGDWKQAFLMPLVGLVLFILNTALAAYFYKKKERIASYILLLASFMAQLSLIIASISVILINY